MLHCIPLEKHFGTLYHEMSLFVETLCVSTTNSPHGCIYIQSINSFQVLMVFNQSIASVTTYSHVSGCGHNQSRKLHVMKLERSWYELRLDFSKHIINSLWVENSKVKYEVQHFICCIIFPMHFLTTCTPSKFVVDVARFENDVFLHPLLRSDFHLRNNFVKSKVSLSPFYDVA